METTFDLESVKGVAIGIVHGSLTLDEIRKSASTMWRLIEEPEIRILWDLRDAQFDLTETELRGAAEYFRSIARSTEFRAAFVVSDDLEFGLVRMFEVFRGTEGARTSTFRDKERAVEWLTNDAT
jgi:hypothetical protein